MDTAIKEYIDKNSAKLALTTSISGPEAERRASLFLEVNATITTWRHLLTEHKIKLQSVQTAVYAEQLSKGTAKTVTENKTIAESSAEYTSAREDFEYVENDLAYLKAYAEIFLNAHIFYRAMMRHDS